MSWYCSKRFKEDVKKEKEELANKIECPKGKIYLIGAKKGMVVSFAKDSGCPLLMACSDLCEHKKPA